MASQNTRDRQTMALLRAYQGLEEIHAAFEGASLALEKARVAPVCIERCGCCCEVNTPYLWDIEANYIISAALGNNTLPKLLDRAECWLLDRHRGLTIYGQRPDMTAKGKVAILKENAVAAGLPCPFLDPDKRCAIHDVRPLACRAYGVTRLPSQQHCRVPLGPHETASRRAYFASAELRSGVETFLARLPVEWRAAYFLPADLYRLARRDQFLALADRIATAKTVAFPITPAMLWQEDLERQWALQGVR